MRGWLRNAALVAGVAYLVGGSLYLLSAFSPQDSADLVRTVVLGGATVAGAAMLIAGAARWDGRSRQLLRLLGWILMLPGIYIFASFSVLAWPLLVLALPAVVVGSGQGEPGRRHAEQMSRIP